MITEFPEIRIGCQVSEQVSAGYWKEFQAFELSERVLQTVKAKTLRKWRAAAPKNAEFIPTFGSLAVANGLVANADETWSRLLSVCDALGARTVLLRTPPSFRPSEANRDAIKMFMAKCPDTLQCVWWAEGLWESDSESLDALCHACGLIRAVDPLGQDDGEPLPDGPNVYWRLMGRRGMTGRFTDYEMDQLTALVSQRHTAYVMFTTPSMLRSARSFSQLVDEERQMAFEESEAE